MVGVAAGALRNYLVSEISKHEKTEKTTACQTGDRQTDSDVNLAEEKRISSVSSVIGYGSTRQWSRQSGSLFNYQFTLFI